MHARWSGTLPGRAAVVLAAVIATLATASAAAQETKVLHVARRAQFETLDPARIQDQASNDIVSLVYSSLLRLAYLDRPARLEPDLLAGFVRIAADPGFVIGTRRQDAARVAKIIKRKVGDYEINHTPTPTPAFYIARYPVTVAQFRTFVEATGFAIGDAYAEALADADSRPVRWVSWHEALAWCDWLNEVLTQGRSFAGSPIARLVREHGWRVALPSELEWEKAARSGLSAAVFPWGDDADPNGANHGDSGIGDTSAVGCFAANGFGLFDMVGNVWEWTRSLYLDYPYDPEVLDVSSTGCMAKSDSRMPPGLQMKVSLFLSDGHDWPVRVDEAVVRWARGGEFGVEFLAIRPAQLQRIQQFVIKARPLS